MSIPDLIRRSARSLKTAKARTLLTAFAIAVGTFALTLTLAASNGAQAFVGNIISENFDPTELIVANDEAVLSGQSGDKPREYDPSFTASASNAGATIQIKRLTKSDIDAIKKIEGVERVRENIDLNLSYITRKGEKKFIATAQGLSPAQDVDIIAGERTEPLVEEGTLLLPEGYVKSLGFKNAKEAVGENVTLAIQKPLDEEELGQLIFQGATQDELAKATANSKAEKKFTIAGVMKKPTSAQPGTELYLFMNPDDVSKLNDIATKGTKDYQKYTYAFVRVENGENQEILNKVQDKIKDKGYVAQSVAETQEFLTQIINILEGIVAAFGAIAVIASVFGIINTMYISVLQRTREIGLMKALGMRRRDIGRLFRFEAALIGLLGGIIGASAAIGTGIALNPWITKTLELGADDRLLIFQYDQVAILIAVLVVISITAGWLPSRKATKLDPIEALRTE